MATGNRGGSRGVLLLAATGGLAALVGALGLLAAHVPGERARDALRAERLALQHSVARTVEQHVLLAAAEVTTALEADAAWSATPRDPGTTQRLKRLVERTRALDAGAILVSAEGQWLASWGSLPEQDDPGWQPLRSSALAVPLSGVLTADGRPVLAMGLPVPLVNGTRGVVLGLWDARGDALQQYVSGLRYGATGHGLVVDGAGRVVAGPDARDVGQLVLPALRRPLGAGRAGITDTRGGGRALVTSFAPAGSTGWTALTPQDRSELEGGLTGAARLVQGHLVALLLIAALALVALHRNRARVQVASALRDGLTRLYNRRGWFLLAEHELERARRQGSPRVILFINVVGLTQINERLGRKEGDRAIADAARVVRAGSRSSDIAGRLGGDEFVLLFNEDGRSDVAPRRMADALRVHNERCDASFELRLSIGLEVWSPQSGLSLEDLVFRARRRMYAEKQRGIRRHDGLLRPPAAIRPPEGAIPVRVA